MFVDQAQIEVRAGNGGDGCVSFLRSGRISKGGPDGGNGGRGGDVIFEVDEGLNTLVDFRGHHHWHAAHGEQGRSRQQYGADAKDLVVRVPAGTLVYDAETGEILHDLGPGAKTVVARGGRGGLGNEHFKSATNQAPKKATPGKPGERFALRLELKLIAEVGLVGLPNAGKSTLLRTLTRAEPKVASYPFTTLAPRLGIAQLDPGRRIVLADIPGLIEGAAEGAGLGHEFLRHVERTSVIVHVIDAAAAEEAGADSAGHAGPAERYRVVREELGRYASALAEKPELIAINKADLLGEEADELARRLRVDLRLGAEQRVCVISGGTGRGLHELLETLWSMLEPSRSARRAGGGRGWSIEEESGGVADASGGAAGEGGRASAVTPEPPAGR